MYFPIAPPYSQQKRGQSAMGSELLRSVSKQARKRQWARFRSFGQNMAEPAKGAPKGKASPFRFALCIPVTSFSFECEKAAPTFARRRGMQKIGLWLRNGRVAVNAVDSDGMELNPIYAGLHHLGVALLVKNSSQLRKRFCAFPLDGDMSDKTPVYLDFLPPLAA
jgi:hypothetical protein